MFPRLLPMLLCFAIGIGATPVGALAQATVPDTAAARYVGQTVTVEGVVANVFTSRAGNTFLNFGAAYPNQTFSAVVFSRAAGRFPNLPQWEGRRVRVTGRVQLYRGRPEIILNSPEAIAPAPN